MSLRILFSFMLVVSVCLTSLSSYGSSLDIRDVDRADPFTSSTGESQWQAGLRENVGIITNSVILEEPSRSIAPSSVVGCPSCMQGMMNTDDKGDKPGADTDADEEKKDKSSSLNKSSFGGEGQAYSGNAQGLNGSTVKVINGVPYVFHKEDIEAEKNDMKISKPDTLLRQAPQLSAVEMNRLADSGSKTSGYQPRGGTAGVDSGTAGGFGDYESSGRKSGSVSLSAAESALKGFSKGFHGTAGASGRGSSSLKFKNGKFKMTKNKKRGPASSNLANAKDILNKQLQLRMYSNRLEFGSSDSFIFESMCQHYITYARKNGIPMGKKTCPKN